MKDDDDDRVNSGDDHCEGTNGAVRPIASPSFQLSWREGAAGEGKAAAAAAASRCFCSRISFRSMRRMRNSLVAGVSEVRGREREVRGERK